MILTSLGALAILKKAFKNVGDLELTARAFVNDFTPTTASVAGNFIEASGGGYAAIALNAADYTVEIVGDIATMTHAPIVFTFTGGLTDAASIYGCYITDSTGVVIFAQRAAVSFTPDAAGEQYGATAMQFELT